MTAGQLPATSIASATTNGVQQVTQQQAQVQQQQTHGQQSQQGQTQTQSQLTTTGLVSIKAPATLQPKPPLQIQPQPVPNQNANQNQHQSQQNQQAQNQQHANQQMQQAQQLTQLQQVTMTQQQVQMIPQQGNTSQPNILSQQILAQSPQQLTAQVMQQAQQGIQQAPKQFTILPSAAQQIQPQPVTLIPQPQQQSNQPQPIRPNYSIASGVNTSSAQPTQGMTAATRPKIRKPGVGRGSNSASPTQQGKTMFPRPTIPANISPLPPQLKPAPTQSVGTTLTKVAIPAQGSTTQTTVNNQPLKTINLAALHHTPPNLPDATLTPLIPQSGSQTQSMQQPPPQPIQVFPATTTQLPSPNISITPAPPPVKKEEPSNENATPPQPPSQQQQHNSQNQHSSETKRYVN